MRDAVNDLRISNVDTLESAEIKPADKQRVPLHEIVGGTSKASAMNTDARQSLNFENLRGT